MQLRFLVLLLVLAPCLLPWSAGAQTLEIDQSEQMNFGALEKPASGSQTFTIAPGGSVSGSGTLLYGSTSRGSYAIRNTGGGPPTSTISIDITNVNPNTSNLTLDSFTGRYNSIDISSFPAAGMAAPGAGASITLYLGATLTYSSAIAVGSPVPSFDIVVDYE